MRLDRIVQLAAWFAPPPIEWWPAIVSALTVAWPRDLYWEYVAGGAMGVIGLCCGQMMRRTEAAARAIREVHHVGQGDPDTVMRAAARWGSDVLGRVARGEGAAEAVAGAALVELAADQQSDAGSAVSEHELHGLGASQQQNGSNWVHNALRSVTPDASTGLSSRDIARMGTVPEDVPYHGQPIVVRRQAHSPPRVAAGAASGAFG
jgi:hypothetical protein